MTDDFKEQKNYWEQLGAEQPYWSILTREDYKKENLTKESESKFFMESKLALKRLHNVCEKAGVDYQKNLCLDYGCGLGRVTFHLAKEFDHVVGVDISKNHIALANNKKAEFQVNNIDFVALEKGVEDIPKRPYDLIFSIIVLQHIRKKEVFRIFSRFIELVKEGGAIIFQIPTFHPNYDFNEGRLNKKLGIMEMHAIRQKDIINYYVEGGCRLEGCFEDNNLCGKDWICNWFLFRK